MDVKEKQAAGLLYDAAHDPLIAEEIYHALDLCWEYNQIRPSDQAARDALLDRLGVKRGKDAIITAPFWCDYGYNLELGDTFYSNHNLTVLDGAKIRIGDNVLIGPNCCLTCASHPLDPAQRAAGLEVAEPITLEDGVWLGAGVTVLGGVTIGENAVIGAGSVVTRDIPPNVIAAGNPCHVLREITEKDREKYRTE